MKHIYFLIGVLGTITISGCGLFGGKGGGADRGEVLGVAARSAPSEIPVGMAYIPLGTFLMGQTDQDITFAQISQTRQVTIPAFFMDQTEITNSQYRQFVNWVRDSIAIVSYLNDPKYYLGATGKGAAAPNPTGKKYIDWKYAKQNPLLLQVQNAVLQVLMLPGYRKCTTKTTIVSLIAMNLMYVY
ncbi:formylglycine-generating enzyme family protein [Mucilaginibacter antarcticus]|uniref:formylglycine-generating enzyme family protein n=1 Tax=Mucilaginibacter antarcticus TaxID=1855725 RepID=UPI003629A7D9